MPLIRFHYHFLQYFPFMITSLQCHYFWLSFTLSFSLITSLVIIFRFINIISFYVWVFHHHLRAHHHIMRLPPLRRAYTFSDADTINAIYCRWLRHFTLLMPLLPFHYHHFHLMLSSSFSSSTFPLIALIDAWCRCWWRRCFYLMIWLMHYATIGFDDISLTFHYLLIAENITTLSIVITSRGKQLRHHLLRFHIIIIDIIFSLCHFISSFPLSFQGADGWGLISPSWYHQIELTLRVSLSLMSLMPLFITPLLMSIISSFSPMPYAMFDHFFIYFAI